jgi:putative sigma-54 modulation protein
MIDFPKWEDLPVQRTASVEGVIEIVGSSANKHASQCSSIFRHAPKRNPKGTQKNMNSTNHTPELIVSGIHLDLTPSLKTYVREKTERLFRHEERIIRIRVELECDPKQSVSNRFTAKGHISINGPDMNASVASDECHKAVSLLVDKLDRMLNRRSKYFKAKRHLAQSIDVDAVIPKMA